MAHGEPLSTMHTALTRVAAAALLGVCALLPAPALAQPTGDDASFVRKVNDIYKGRDRAVPDSRRADMRLFPAAAAMSPPPAAASTPLRAALLSPGAPGWSDAENWARADAQTAVLDAVREIGDPSKRFAFLHGYGRDAVPREWADAGLFVDLGEPPILAAAQFDYFDALERIGALVNVEATRLVNDGQGKDGATLLVRWVFLGRALADREYYAEKKVADVIMRSGLERLRDLVYTHPDAFTDADIRDVIALLDARQVLLERLLYPRADRIAAEQVLARAYSPGGGPHAERFGPTLARIASSGRPLTMFGEAARWQGATAGVAGTYDTSDELDAVYDDWLYRWDLAYFDDIVTKRPSDYDRMDKAKFAVVDRLVGPTQGMFTLRQRLDADFAGTRMALGGAAFQRRFNHLPETIAAVRPSYVQRVETDPFSRDGADFHYFVPTRGQRVGPREIPTPHTINVTINPGAGGATGAAPIAHSITALPSELWLDGHDSATRAQLESFVGRAAPPLRVSDWTEGGSSLDDLSGEIVLLNFWGTWCGPCKAAIPTHNKVQEEFASQGVRVISVCNTRGSETMVETAKAHNMAYPTARDIDDATVRAYGVRWFPFNVLVDRNGVIRAAGVPPQTSAAAIRALLAEQPAQARTGPGATRSVEMEEEMMREVASIFGELTGEMYELQMSAIRSGTAPDQRRVDEITERAFKRIDEIVGESGESGESDESSSDPSPMKDRMLSLLESTMWSLMSNSGGTPPTKQQVSDSIRDAMMSFFREQVEAFSVDLDDSVFVLYSVGADGERQWARRVGDGGPDLLYWPPLMSLIREEMARRGTNAPPDGRVWFDYTPAQRAVVVANAGEGKKDEQVKQTAEEPAPGREPRIR